MTVRARLLLLLLVAALPVAIVAVVIAYQNAQIVAGRGLQSIASVRDMAQKRQQSFVTQGTALLVALAGRFDAAQIDKSICVTHLQAILAAARPRYERLALVDDTGLIRCDAVMEPTWDQLSAAELAAVARARISPGVQSGPFSTSAGGGATIPLALAVQPAGIVLATIREAGLLDVPNFATSQLDLCAWFITPSGPIPLLPGTPLRAAPTPADLVRLQQVPDRLLEGSSLDGQRYLYAVAELGPDLTLVLGEPAVAFLSEADMLLGRRLIELGLVILLGLAIVAVGADLSLGRPLKQVARVVGRWRAGGAFDPLPFRYAPYEIRELAESFSKAVAALAGREQQLRDATVKQELLMQEIHHRVKNNLQVVASLLNLQASRIRQPAARAEFHAARDRIRALATLHRHLYAHGELHTINMRGFLDELCDQLLQAMGETPGGGRIALTIEATELQISSDQAVPIALLVTEAVSNAVKYAFPGGRSGHIAVRLAVARDPSGRETARLSIDDDGVGIPAGRAETESGVRDGLGLRLIHGFALQLGSELEVREENGTHYAVNIVLRRERADDESGEEAEGVTGQAA